MHKESKIRAEEFLAEENFSEELLSQYVKDRTIDDNEIQIVQTIYSFLSSSNEGLTSLEKEQTKNQIRFTVRRLSLKKKLVRWSVAATLLLAAILTSIGYLGINQTKEIVNYAQTLTNIKGGTDTRIILQNGAEIHINKTQSQIRYDAKGENIRIDSSQNVVQNINNSNVIFNTVIVPYGKRSQIVLSDGTKVWMNSGSKLIYPALFAENKREVYIEGEAVFDVVHLSDKPFIVITKDFNIKDLGTVFNISTYPEDHNSSVVLERGKIEINFRGNSVFSREKIDISPGTMAVFDRYKKSFEQQHVNPQKYLSWREGYLILNGEKLGDILKKIGRFYNIEMVVTDNDLSNTTYSGYLDLKNSPSEVLKVINETTSLTYSLGQGKIFINPK